MKFQWLCLIHIGRVIDEERRRKGVETDRNWIQKSSFSSFSSYIFFFRTVHIESDVQNLAGGGWGGGNHLNQFSELGYKFTAKENQKFSCNLRSY